MSDTPLSDAAIDTALAGNGQDLRELCRELERGLRRIVKGDYAPGAEKAHPAIRYARRTLELAKQT
jgi:hypothetical protein